MNNQEQTYITELASRNPLWELSEPYRNLWSLHLHKHLPCGLLWTYRPSRMLTGGSVLCPKCRKK